MEKKIDLLEIIEAYKINGDPEFDNSTILLICLEFGKQLLELAVENAKIIEIYNAEEHGFNDAWQKVISKQSILDTIKQVE